MHLGHRHTHTHIHSFPLCQIYLNDTMIFGLSFLSKLKKDEKSNKKERPQTAPVKKEPIKRSEFEVKTYTFTLYKTV